MNNKKLLINNNELENYVKTYFSNSKIKNFSFEVNNVFLELNNDEKEYLVRKKILLFNDGEYFFDCTKIIDKNYEYENKLSNLLPFYINSSYDYLFDFYESSRALNICFGGEIYHEENISFILSTIIINDKKINNIDIKILTEYWVNNLFDKDKFILPNFDVEEIIKKSNFIIDLFFIIYFKNKKNILFPISSYALEAKVSGVTKQKIAFDLFKLYIYLVTIENLKFGIFTIYDRINNHSNHNYSTEIRKIDLKDLHEIFFNKSYDYEKFCSILGNDKILFISKNEYNKQINDDSKLKFIIFQKNIDFIFDYLEKLNDYIEKIKSIDENEINEILEKISIVESPINDNDLEENANYILEVIDILKDKKISFKNDYELLKIFFDDINKEFTPKHNIHTHKITLKKFNIIKILLAVKFDSLSFEINNECEKNYYDDVKNFIKHYKNTDELISIIYSIFNDFINKINIYENYKDLYSYEWIHKNAKSFFKKIYGLFLLTDISMIKDKHNDENNSFNSIKKFNNIFLKNIDFNKLNNFDLFVSQKNVFNYISTNYDVNTLKILKNFGDIIFFLNPKKQMKWKKEKKGWQLKTTSKYMEKCYDILYNILKDYIK